MGNYTKNMTGSEFAAALASGAVKAHVMATETEIFANVTQMKGYDYNYAFWTGAAWPPMRNPLAHFQGNPNTSGVRVVGKTGTQPVVGHGAYLS